VRNPLRSLFETRSAIASSYALAKFLLGHASSVSGQSVTEQTALNVAAVWTGVNWRSRLRAALPIDVIERVGERERKPRPDHHVAQLLEEPNSWQTGPELRGMLEAHRLLRGNGYAWKNIVRDALQPGAARVTELIPMHPDQMEILDADDEFKGIGTYRLHRRKGTHVDIPANEVLHLRNLSTDGKLGRSFIADLREVIGGALATQEHANSLWSRDATPSVALRHPKTLGQKGKKNLEDSWEATYGRGKDKRRVAVLEEGMEIQQLSLSPEDGQFLQTQQDLRAQIAAALMVPPHLMGLSEKATSWGSGIEQQNIGLVKLTLQPDLTVWEARLRRDLIGQRHRFQIKFNPAAMMRGDAMSQGQFFWLMRQMGAMSANDVRAMFDWNPIADGDVYLQPTNLAPLGSDPLQPRQGGGA
jgi:HK97 family phage portal protein